MEEPVHYKSFLIRLWPRRIAGVPDLGVMLESVGTGQRRTLPNLESLVAFLQAEVAPWEFDVGTTTVTTHRVGSPAPGR
jgi:hypothetical protein